MTPDRARTGLQVRRWKRPFGAPLRLVFLVFLLIFLGRGMPRHSPEGPFSPLEPQKPQTVEEYEDQCRKAVDEEQRERCREALPVFRHSLMWIDSRLLLRDGEELSSKHLDVLYGFSAPGADAARIAVTSHLASWCRREGLPTPTTFNDLKRQGCTDRLPTLAEMGLELNPKWAGVRSIKSSYDGRTTLVPVTPVGKGKPR
jgi:hypothetical protein